MNSLTQKDYADAISLRLFAVDRSIDVSKVRPTIEVFADAIKRAADAMNAAMREAYLAPMPSLSWLSGFNVCRADPRGHLWRLNGSKRDRVWRPGEVAETTACAQYARVTLRRCVKCGDER